MYAFSSYRKVWITVEAIRTNIAEDDIAIPVFSAPELAEFHALPLEPQSKGFFFGWTRKEAYTNARGSGMGIIPA